MSGIIIGLGILIVIVVVSIIVGIIWMKSIGTHNFGTYAYLTSLMVGMMVTAGILGVYTIPILAKYEGKNNAFWTYIWGYVFVVIFIPLIIIFAITGIIAASLQSQSQLIWVIATIIWLLVVISLLGIGTMVNYDRI